MPVNSIDLSKKRFAKADSEIVRCRGLFSTRAEEKNGYAQFDRGLYIDTQDARDYSGLGDFSICLWVKKNILVTGFAMCQTHSLLVYVSDWVIANGSALFWMRNKVLGKDSDLNDLKWHHLGFVWDKKKEKYKGYFDGDIVGESDAVADYGGFGSVKIGTRGDAITSFWVGRIAHVKIFLRKLTATDVRNIFHMTSITDGLGSYYPLSENAQDFSGHGKNGKNHGAVFKGGW